MSELFRINSLCVQPLVGLDGDESQNNAPSILRNFSLTINEGESESELHERIKVIERALLVETIEKLALAKSAQEGN